MGVQNPVIVHVDGTIKYKRPTDKFGLAYMATWSSCRDYMHTSKMVEKTNNSTLVELIALKETMKYLLNRRSKRMRFILLQCKSGRLQRLS